MKRYEPTIKLLENLPETMTARRRALGVSLQHVADELQVTKFTVWGWERRKHGMHLANAVDVIRWLAETEDRVPS